jgi:hypothetical protein
MPLANRWSWLRPAAGARRRVLDSAVDDAVDVCTEVVAVTATGRDV